jgi:threonine-phosphate decarboxylase
MKPYLHGGGAAQAAIELGIPLAELVDFSASINPQGMPAGVLRAVQESLTQSVHYPEVDATTLREALALYHNLPAENILPGNGSTELMYHFARTFKPRRAMLVVPAFSEYERSLRLTGTKIDYLPLSPDNGFQLNPETIFQKVHPSTDLVLFANPGNPTGAGIDPATIQLIASQLNKRAVVVVDEAFIDFCPELSIIEHVTAHENLYVLRSLTKFYAIPGLRAGYLAGPARGVANQAATREPWPLSTPSLAAAKACLNENSFRQQTLDLIPELRKNLAVGLKNMGMTVFPSMANYLLARLENEQHNATNLAETLRRKGLLIRNCANFPPLDDRYLRVAVRTANENYRLLSAIESIFAEWRHGAT